MDGEHTSSDKVCFKYLKVLHLRCIKCKYITNCVCLWKKDIKLIVCEAAMEMSECTTIYVELQ